MRLELRGAADVRYLFAKLYASNHLRADRWYKLARTILYGVHRGLPGVGPDRPF